MKQQRLLVSHQKLVELQIEVGNKGRDPEYIRGDFGDLGHRAAQRVISFACFRENFCSGVFVLT